MTNMKRLLLLAALLAPVLSADAYTETVDGIVWSYIVVNAASASVGCDWDSEAVPASTTGAITIPSTLGGYPVTSIGKWAFSGCSGLTSITIPDSVTSIGLYAFSSCSGLTSITIPGSVTSIGSDAFSGCSGLVSVTISEGVTSIGEYAFNGCSGLTSVTIPNSVTSIGSGAFSGCSGLTSITIPDSVTSIEWRAFSGCSGLTSVTIPDSVTSIGWEAFYGCANLYDTNTIPSVRLVDGWAVGHEDGLSGALDLTGCRGIGNLAFGGCSGLTSVTIPDSVTTIGHSSFSECSGLVSVTISKGVTSIGEYAFNGCSGLTSITIPDGVTSIVNDVFYGCSGLTSITIPDGVTSIGWEAFYDCSELTSVTIPGSVTSIGSDAFYGCSGLTSVTIPDSVTNIGDGAFYGCSNLYDTNTIRDVRLVDGWVVGYEDGLSGALDLTGCRNIGNGSFFDCSGLTSVSIPDGVTSIGAFAFEYCTGLTSITIPGSVTSIGSDAFSGCSELTSITIPDGVTSIEGFAFAGCSGLTSITIPDNVTSIGDSAFYGCSGLTSITIPDGVTSIGERALYGCSGLTSVAIPNGVTSIGDCAFAGCSGLTSVTIPDGVTSIGKYAFSGCSGLTSITIPDGLTNIWSYAFYGCSGLTSITIPDGVKSIGEYAFYGCSGLTSITIPDGLTNIGSSAFYGCSELTSITIPDGVMSIGGYAFYGCSGLTSITIPDSVTSIGSSAFDGCANLYDTNTIPGVRLVDGWAVGHEDGQSGALDLTGCRGIAGSLLYGCSELTSVTIPDSVTSIGDCAFFGCSGLTSITIPDGVTSIGEYAFYGCSGLTSITIPDSVTSIGSSTFDGCSGLRTLYLPKSLSGTPYVPSGCTIVRYDPVPLSVVSEHGGTNPSPGTHNIPSNFVFTCSADPLLPDPDDPDVRYACRGWTGTGSVPAAGTESIATFTPVESSSIAWLWEKQRRFTNVVAAGADVWFQAESGVSWEAVSDASASDGSSLQSGEVAQGGASELETTVTGPGRLSFAWKIAANRYDYARFYADGAKQAEITRSADWATVGPIELGDGEHPLRWTFERGSAAGGAAFLDEISWRPRYTLSVESTDGTPTPAVGANPVYWGTEVAAHVAEPMPTAGGKTRRACTGWTGTGSVPETGTGTNVVFTVEEDSSLTWNWRTEHWIDVAVESGGTTAFQPKWVAAGERVSVYLSPNWSHYDIVLSGDTNGVTRSGSTLYVPADGPRTLRATITERKYSLVVSSPMGEVSPAPGTHLYSYGSYVAATAVSPLREENGEQVVCAGWMGTGSVSSSGTGTSKSFYIYQDSSITWKWATNVWIDVAVSGGSTSFVPRWVRKGTTAEIELTPATHLFDIALSGDVADGVELDGTTLRVLADKPRTIRVAIAERKISLTVSSAFGTAVPAVGTHQHSWGDAVTASAIVPPAEDGTRTMCTGWTGTGSVPACGSGTAVSFTMETNSSLAWRWRTDHWISVETAGPVETDFKADWHAEGETLEVAYDVLFDGECAVTLGGDTNGVALDATARVVSIPCDRVRAIRISAAPEAGGGELDLKEALDAPKLSWTSEGGNAWTPQTAVTADGEDAAASGAAGTAGGGDSVLSTRLAGPGTLSWSWRLETAGGSGIDLVVDGNTPLFIEEDKAGAWIQGSVAISGEGTHEVSFVFWNEMGESADRGYLDGVSWTGAVAGSDETATTPEPVPHTWLVANGIVAAGASDAAFEAAALATAQNGRPVWECYVAGLDPRKDDNFLASIDMAGGEPVVSWWPSNVAGRAYAVWGKATLADDWSSPVNAAHHFFQVRVALDGAGADAFEGPVAVTFDPAGGTVDPATKAYAEPGALGALPVPVRDGYDFLGWWTRETGGVRVDETTAVPWSDWTFYARWRQLDPLATALNPALVFTKGGDANWFAESDETHDGVAAARSGTIGQSQSTWIETTVKGPGTVAFWWKVSSEESCDILSLSIDGSERVAISGVEGWSKQTIELFDNGEHVLRWNYCKDGSGNSGSDCGWLDEVSWTPAPVRYTITFDSDGGSAVAPITSAYGAALTAPGAPTKDGYDFAGWNPAFPATMPLNGATLVAQWTPKNYTISFNTGDGTIVAPITAAYGSAVTAPSNPTKEGFTFAGWSPAFPETMPLGGATLVAQWTATNANSFTWTVSGNDVTITGVDGTPTGALVIPATINGHPVTAIGWSAFRSCRELTSVSIPEGVTSIGNYAFRDCNELMSISIPNGGTNLGGTTFYGCSRLTEIAIPAGVTIIDGYAFYGCSQLASISVPEGVTTIWHNAFQNCSGLPGIDLPDSMTTIGNNVFQNCSALTSLTIPDNVTSIGSYSFSGCTGLTSLSLPGRFRGKTSSMGIPDGCTVTFRD